MTPQQYRLELGNQQDELCRHLVGVESFENHLCRNGYGWGHAACSRLQREGVEIHHISGGMHRKNLRSNLIALHRLTHIWCQEIDVQGGKVACLWAKSCKGELNWDEMRDAAGKDLRGVMEGYDLSGRFVEWRDILSRSV